MPLAEPPPRDSRFGSPLKLSRVHWVRPELVVVKHLAALVTLRPGRPPPVWWTLDRRPRPAP
jgi:hypothetical protein